MILFAVIFAVNTPLIDNDCFECYGNIRVLVDTIYGFGEIFLNTVLSMMLIVDPYSIMMFVVVLISIG